MIRRIERDQILSELTAVEALLQDIAKSDPAAQIAFQSRRAQLQAKLQELETTTDNQAAVALFFGGKPVIGSRAIQAEFATSALASFQDIVSKVWFSNSDDGMGARGPVRFEAGAQLHITNVVHGSFGFVLEEVEDAGRLFPSPLKSAVDTATEIVSAFANADEPAFQELIEQIHPRVFSSMRDFFRNVKKDEAVFRIVEGEREFSFDENAVERAYARAEEAAVEEDEISISGELLGVIPFAGRFEFRTSGGELISGKVSNRLSESYLERVEREQVVGRVWIAKMRRREVRRPGRRTTNYLLIDLV